jgi:hypothetical protein
VHSYWLSQTFCLGCHWTLILLTSASHVGRITDVSHHPWNFFAFYKIGINEKCNKLLTFICKPEVFIFNCYQGILYCSTDYICQTTFIFKFLNIHFKGELFRLLKWLYISFTFVFRVWKKRINKWKERQDYLLGLFFNYKLKPH